MPARDLSLGLGACWSPVALVATGKIDKTYRGGKRSKRGRPRTESEYNLVEREGERETEQEEQCRSSMRCSLYFPKADKSGVDGAAQLLVATDGPYFCSGGPLSVRKEAENSGCSGRRM